MAYTLHNGDCLQVMATLPDNSVDAVITDPPYELGFMGKGWDSTGIAYNVDVWRQALRVLKPGGHLLAFSGTRTYHRMACAIEDAGFEIRDMIEWVYGSGFPKSLDIGKAVDKIQGNGREVKGIGKRSNAKGSITNYSKWDRHEEFDITRGTSPWEGWGTAMKPAHEPICMARKPLSERNVALNVLKWGTGGINVDATRIGCGDRVLIEPSKHRTRTGAGFEGGSRAAGTTSLGRFPANLILDTSDEVRACFPETGKSKYKAPNARIRNNGLGLGTADNRDGLSNAPDNYGDSGSAARFFKSIVYTAKASKADRGEGNIHSTVKPTALMEYLITMIAPPAAAILDPFMGSGTTGVAAIQTGRRFIGIEIDPTYYAIAEKRIKQALLQIRMDI